MSIYIVCPYNKSGGPRSLHQLANKLVDRGIKVYMYYGLQNKPQKVSKLLYSDCKAKIAHSIEDRSENVLIVPESDTGWLKKYKKIKKVIWWLSLYFYLENNIWWLANERTRFLNQPSFLSGLRYLHIKFTHPYINYIHPKYLKDVDYHIYNCEYVHKYLLAHEISKSKMSYLCGPIDIEEKSRDKFQSKKNLIVYNPAKASPYMLRKILKYMEDKYPEYKVKPLHGISHETLLKYLNIAKVYLDLGYFPGPERMPREASMNYCNIITSTVGAAANNYDVLVPKKFKFDLEEKNVSKICKLMVDMCNNYEYYVDYYDEYRKKTLSQIKNFDSDIDNFVKAIRLIEK